MRKNNLKNIIYTFLGQIIVLGLALIVPRLVLTSYGSDTNGLISTVTQIMSYLALLEAGIGQATRNELYQYNHGDTYDKSNISLVMSVSRKSYRDITKVYAVLVILLSFILPVVINTDLNYLTVLLVVLIEGASGVVSFYFVQNWMNLLAVDGKQYINSNIDLIFKVLIYLVKIGIALSGISIVFMEIGFFIATVIKLLLYRLYINKYYKWIDYQKDTEGRKLKDRKAYIVSEVSWTVFSSTDLIVLSIFCSTKSSSVYSIYSMIFLTINKLLDAVYTSLKFNLGQSFHNNEEEYRKTHDLFNSGFIGIISALMIVAYYLCLPFVSLYTDGINDIDYIDNTLPMGFCLVVLFSWYRMIAEHLNGVAGYAKPLSKISLIEAATNLCLSILLVNKFGIKGVLYATVIALPIKIIYCNWLADKVILKRSIFNTVKILGINAILFFGLALVKDKMPLTINSYVDILKYAVIFTLISSAIFLTGNIIANRNVLTFLKGFGKKD